MENQHFHLRSGSGPKVRGCYLHKPILTIKPFPVLGSCSSRRDTKQKSEGPSNCDGRRCQWHATSQQLLWLLLSCSVLGKHQRALRCNKLSYWKILFHLPGKLGYLETVFWNTYIDIQLYSSASVVKLPLSDHSPLLGSAQTLFTVTRMTVSPSAPLRCWLPPGRSDWTREEAEGESVRLALASEQSQAAGRRWQGISQESDYVKKAGLCRHLFHCLCPLCLLQVAPLKPFRGCSRIPWACPSSDPGSRCDRSDQLLPPWSQRRWRTAMVQPGGI